MSRRDRLTRALQPLSRRAFFPAAHVYRRTLLRPVRFIGVTGSSGKTTTKELIGAILSRRFRGAVSPGDLNVPRSIARTILKQARPWHHFCVVEVGLRQRPLDHSVTLVAPHVAVVTAIGTEHITAFRSAEALAAEKGKLVAALRRGGTAVLNADDPRVLAMGARCQGSVITYGVSPAADVRAEDVQGHWPDRLSFTVVHAGQTHRVRTQLCGVHWVPAVLAALTAGLALGVELAEAAEVVATVPPFPGRLSPEFSPDGVTFVRDDIKAPFWSMSLALDFMKEARASRRVVVIGTISDFLGSSDRAYRAVAGHALGAAEHVLFVGSNGGKVLRDTRYRANPAIAAAPTVEAARRHLERVLRPGDLVLLKGSRVDDLGRLAGTRLVSVPEPGEPGIASGACDDGRVPVRLVVGLGNPGERYVDTPHNVGQRALERVAASLSASWTAGDEAMIARVDHPGGTCYLVKPLVMMNVTGPVLRRLAERLRVKGTDCILLQDDIDLPVGAARTRLAGGDGGHRGVRSVLEALQTLDVPRVKVGVGRPRAGGDVARHVLDTFGPGELDRIDAACAEAVSRTRELVGIPKRRRTDPATRPTPLTAASHRSPP